MDKHDENDNSVHSINTVAMPLSETQQTLLVQLIHSCNSHQLSWLSGYCWAVAQQTHSNLLSVSTSAVSTLTKLKMSVIYLSQTGNSRMVAQKLVTQAETQGITLHLFSADDCKVKQLADNAYLFIIASTHGEGEPPDNTLRFYNDLMSRKAPDLKNTQFAVLALGDSSYEQFCYIGKTIDARLEALGGIRWLPRVECDADFDLQAESWITSVLQSLQNITPTTDTYPIALKIPDATETKRIIGTREHPFSAEIITKQRITGRYSDKNVCHVELDLSHSGLQYAAGDTLGIWFENDPQLIELLLAHLKLDKQTQVTLSNETMTLQDALRFKRELTTSTVAQIKKWADLSQDNSLIGQITRTEQLQQYAMRTQIVDIILASQPPACDAQQLVDFLRGLSPRLYSIASSMEEVGEEVHLCIGMIDYEHNGQPRHGGATGFISRQSVEDKINIYIKANNSFHLPESTTDIIMIGAGTGIAPFRAFMQERIASGATGKNWLFFGNPHFSEDFLYQTEWQRYLAKGELTRLDLAFSRDQADKIYVQHKMLTAEKTIWQWLQQGACLYVCGDRHQMAKNVQDALEEIVCRQGRLSREDAQHYLGTLRQENRYCRDVY